MGEEWDDSLQSKEQIEAGLLNKHGAAMRRERALAYAFSHQVSYVSIMFPAHHYFYDQRTHWMVLQLILV